MSRRTPDEAVEDLRKAEEELAAIEAEIEAFEAEEGMYEPDDDYENVERVERVEEDESELAASIEELDKEIAFFTEQMEQAKQRIETNRRGVKLGYLKLANQARRCAHLKNNGQPCQAPAVGEREFCSFIRGGSIAKPIRELKSASSKTAPVFNSC